jgi:anti-sigma factor ChrR (cupin superfamily)
MNGAPEHEALLDLVAVAALGSLPAAELRVVTLHLATCEECRTEYAALRPAADAIGLIADEPIDSLRSARMKKRLLAAIAPSGAARRVSAPGGLIWASSLVAAAAVVFALISTVQDIRLRSDLANAQRTAAQLQTRVAETQQTNENERDMLADLFAANAKRYPVPDGEVVARGSHVYFSLRALPPLPKGKVYQAWTLAKGAKTVAPSVTFTPNAAGAAIVQLPANASTLAAVALSVEPEGGSKAPTSKPTFIQPLS